MLGWYQNISDFHLDLFSILGLQVQSPDSKHWINVPCNADAFVVNTGVGMQRMTNDRYKVKLVKFTI